MFYQVISGDEEDYAVRGLKRELLDLEPGHSCDNNDTLANDVCIKLDTCLRNENRLSLFKCVSVTGDANQFQVLSANIKLITREELCIICPKHS